MNTVTPRIFVAATEQNDGKTTTSLGLFAALRKRLGRIGYIKPVGQRFVTIDGMNIDEDTVLIDQTYRVHTPLEAMSPIAVEPDFTRRYIEEAQHDSLVRRIRHSFDRAAWEKDFVIIEGSGRMTVDDETQEVQQWDAIPSRLRGSHGLYNHTQEDLEVLVVAVCAEKGKFDSTDLGDDLSRR